MTLLEALTPEQIARNKAIRFRAIAESMDFLRSHLFAMEDAAINELGQLYLNYYRELYQELVIVAERYGVGATWSASDADFRERTEYLMAQITEDVKRLTDDAAAQTFEAMVRGYSGGYYGAAWVVDNGLRTGAYANIPILPIEAIRTAMLQPYLGSTFLDRFADARDEFVRRIRRSIVESQIRGEGIDAAAMRLRQALGIGAGDPRGFFARVEMIARTEILRASNEGTLAIYEANQDVLKGFEWIATKDERTCPICGSLDSTQYKFDQEYPVPPAHPMCRCALTPVLIDSDFEAAIIGPRQSYREWASARGVSIVNDGGILRFRGQGAPKSPSTAAKAKVVKATGTPVSKALKIPGGAKMESVRNAAAAIDKVHGDGELPEIPVVPSTGKRRTGTYWSTGGRADRIAVSVPGDHPGMTFSHEVGHFLDHQAIGQRGLWASEGSDLLDNWRAAIKNSRAYQSIVDTKPGTVVKVKLENGYEVSYKYDRNFLSYLQTRRELFARSYAQYIAVRSQDPELLKELDRMIAKQGVQMQWQADDFKDIATAFDELFAFQGWRK